MQMMDFSWSAATRKEVRLARLENGNYAEGGGGWMRV